MTTGAPSAADPFAPTLTAAMARLAAVNLDHYARARNSLDGPVTRLSPYVTHGFLTLPNPDEAGCSDVGPSRRVRRRAHPPGVGWRGHQPAVPGPPLNGPTMADVIHPP